MRLPLACFVHVVVQLFIFNNFLLVLRVVARKYLQPSEGVRGIPRRGHRCCRPRMASQCRSILTDSLSVGLMVVTSLCAHIDTVYLFSLGTWDGLGHTSIMQLFLAICGGLVSFTSVKGEVHPKLRIFISCSVWGAESNGEGPKCMR